MGRGLSLTRRDQFQHGDHPCHEAEKEEAARAEGRSVRHSVTKYHHDKEVPRLPWKRRMVQQLHPSSKKKT